MDTPDDQPLNPNQRYAPHETAITYFSYNPNHSQQPWKAMMLNRSLCHANYQAMQRVATSDGKGLEKGAKEKVKACPGCREGKATKQPYYKENNVDRQYKKGEALNFDFKGPYPLASVYDMYSATLPCSASKFARDVYTPSRAARFYLRHIIIGFRFFETQTGNKCKVFRCDGELATTAVLQMCEDNGTIFKQTTRNESRMNPFAERIHRSNDGMCMATLLNSGLPSIYWKDANRAANASRMLVPLAEGPYKGATPWEIIKKTKIDPSFLQPVGCLCYVMMPTTTKGQPRAIPATYLGPKLYRRTYKILLHNHRKPTVVDKPNVTFNPEVRGYGIKGAQQLTWQSGQVGHSATSTTQQRHDGQNSGGPAMVPVTNLFGNADRADPSFSRPLFNDPPSQPSFEEGQESKEVVFEVVTPLQEQGRGPARAIQGHNAVGRSVGVDIPILSPQLPTAQLESTLTFPETTVNEQAVGQAGGQRVGKIARVPILAAPNNYGKQLAKNDIAGDIVQSAIIHGPRARRPTPITHPTHQAVEERTGDDQETSDITNFALFTRVIQVPAKKARDHPLVYAAQKEEVDGLYKMGTLT
eukprot:g19186.t1